MNRSNYGYKESGVVWLGAIPDHWELKKVKHLALFYTGWTPPSGNDEYYDGVYPWANISDLGTNYLETPVRTITQEAIDTLRMRMSKKGSLLFSFKLSIGLVSILGKDMYTNEAIATFPPNDKINTTYLYYLAPVAIPMNAGVNIYNAPMLNQESIKNAVLVYPPVEEQQNIAAFLDQETARIDALISKKERMIELLKEKRIALITQAVTKGLDPNVPMKDSGIEWLGEVPEHWEVIKLKFIGKALIGLTYNPDDIVFENGTLVLRASNIQDSSLSLGREDDVYVEAQIPRKLMVIINDILICSRNGSRSLIGKSAIVKSDLYATFGAFMTVYRSRFNTFIRWVLQSSMFSSLCSGYVTSTINQLTQDSLNNISVPLPSENELERINEFLESEVHRSETMIAKTEHSISLLREYRSSLIHHAVTGKIDLRGYDAQAQ